MRDGLVREEADRNARCRAVTADLTDAKQPIPRDLLCDDATFRNAVIAQQHLALFDVSSTPATRRSVVYSLRETSGGGEAPESQSRVSQLADRWRLSCC
jgi:hypothetical protein